LVQYKRLKMEIHAEDSETEDGEVTAFIRLGTDFQQNYYEVEVPLKMSPIPSSTREEIWPRENEIDVAFEELFTLKAQRNREGRDPTSPYPDASVPGLNLRGKYRVTVVGNPDLSSVQTVMLGIRNPKTDDQLPKAVCVWMNELRVTEFDQTSGWATTASLSTKLADFATVSTTMRYNTVGFGGIQDRVQDRARSTSLDYDISANVQLDKILLGKLGISLPLYVSYERSQTDPFFDPLDPDVPLDLALTTFNNPAASSDYLNKVRDQMTRRSINLTNVRKQKLKEDAKNHLWDIENLSLTAAYSDAISRNINTEIMLTRQWKLGAVYGYTSQAKPFEPFKESEAFNSPWLQLIKDFNLQLMPTSIAIRGDLTRNFRKIQLRNSDLTTDGLLPTFEKAFLFNRAYNVNWALSQNLGIDYSALANAIVDEPAGDIDSQLKRDQIMENLRDFGRMKRFNQTIGLNYRVPFDKFPLTNWLKADTRYTAGVDWVAGTLGIADTLGNNIRNNNSLAVNGQIDLNSLYNKVPALERINSTQRRRNQKTQDPLELKKQRLQERLNRVNEKIKKREEREQKRAEKRAAKDSLRNAQQDSLAVQPAPDPADTVQQEEKPSRLEKKRERLEQRIAEIDEELERREANNYEPREMKALKGVAKVLMSVKNINASYTQNNNTVLPGFMPIPRFFGFDEGWDAPGIPFLLGSQDPDIRQRAAERGWLATAFSQNNPFTRRMFFAWALINFQSLAG